MFRGCDFEYNGINSNIYNLVLAYKDNDTESFVSGGEYEPITDTLPYATRQLLYGLNYSESPLDFEIEIFNPCGAIPFEQMIEIKNWLFNQDGWKKFRVIDERQEYYLNALLIPEDDIADVSGYRGFKCRLLNDSPFWYQDTEITIKGSELEGENDTTSNLGTSITITGVPDNIKIYPTIVISTGYFESSTVKTTDDSYEPNINMEFALWNKTSESHCVFLCTEWYCAADSTTKYSTTYTINTKYGTGSQEGYQNIDLSLLYPPSSALSFASNFGSSFYLCNGVNELRLKYCQLTINTDGTITDDISDNANKKSLINSITFKMALPCRIGGF